MDLNCPYCDAGLEVCHDDGFGYEEDVKHEMECSHCGKQFIFKTSVVFHYEPEKADCLNDGKHEYEITTTVPKEFSEMKCTICGKEREMTDEERLEFNIGTKEDYFKKIQK